MGVTDFLSNENAVKNGVIVAIVIMVIIILIYILFILQPNFEEVKSLLLLFVGLIAGYIAGGKAK